MGVVTRGASPLLSGSSNVGSRSSGTPFREPTKSLRWEGLKYMTGARYTMATIHMTKLGRRAQTVVPAALRRKYKLREGDRLEWEDSGDALVVRPRRRMTLDDMTGMIAVGGDAVRDKRRVARGELP